ncbi:MAG: phosphoribosyltransferase family protein [Chloroflexota bacterium]
MVYSTNKTLFENRYDAGRKLAEKLTEYQGRPVLVLAIPNGGMPIGLEVALALEAELDIIISRKIPIPLRPESGFGAVTDDGTVILNQQVVDRLGLTQEQVNQQISDVTANIRKRMLLYRGNRTLTLIPGKTVILVDDGLASGYTMLAAIESVRRRRPRQIIVAVPAASGNAVLEVERVCDKVITYVTSSTPEFYIADYYQSWHDLTDDEALKCLREAQVRKFRANLPSANPGTQGER